MGEQLSILRLIGQASIPVQIVIAILLLASVISWSIIFRKRALKPGAAIGYHQQTEDEIYYVLSGQGLMTLDGKEYPVTPGTAILTRTGSSHGLKQTGPDDLVILINYEK